MSTVTTLSELRALREKATPGKWRQSSLAYLYLIAGDDPHPICSLGEYNEEGELDGEFENWQANAALIVALANLDLEKLLAEAKIEGLERAYELWLGTWNDENLGDVIVKAIAELRALAGSSGKQSEVSDDS